MKAGWQIKTLNEVCIVERGSSPRPIKSFFTDDPEGVNWIKISDTEQDGRYVYSTAQKITSEGAKQSRFVKEGDFILTNSMSFGRPYIMKISGYIHDGWFVLRLKETLDTDYFYYLLSSPLVQDQFKNFASGAIVKNISGDLVKKTKLPIPTLPEQHRIVAILDETFESIATAKANAEKNLKNARALFESHLQAVFSQRGEGWVEMTVDQCFKVKSGSFLPARVMVKTGEFDVYGGNGINGKHDQKNLSGDNIVIGRVGEKCGNVRRVLGDFWLTDNAFFISEYFQDFDLGFLARLLELKQLRNTANQAAQPVISYTTIKEVILNFPVSKAAQNELTKEIEKLEFETQHLESIYKQKLAALDELKKSLLHQAFSGQL